MVKTMTKNLRKVRLAAARSQFVQGLGSLLVLSDAPARSRPKPAMENLRGDMDRLGMDMRRVMEREQVYETIASKAHSEPAE